MWAWDMDHLSTWELNIVCAHISGPACEDVHAQSMGWNGCNLQPADPARLSPSTHAGRWQKMCKPGHPGAFLFLDLWVSAIVALHL